MNKNVIIVSSDKDLMQLVDQNTTLFDPMKQFWINDNKFLKNLAFIQ